MKPSGLAIIVISLFLPGCTLPEKVNHHFAPVDEKQQRQTAIDSTAKALSSMTVPTIAAEFSLSDAGHVLLTNELSNIGVTKLSLVGEQQLLKIAVKFHHRFVESDARENVTWRKVIATWKPEVSGSVVLFAGIKNPDISAINLADVPAMDLQLLPALSTIHVTDLKLFGHYQTESLVQPIVGLLNVFKDNVSGILSRSKLATISIPEVATKPLNPDRSFSFKAANQDIVTSVSAHPILIPLDLTGVAWRIAGDRLTILIEVLPKAATEVPSNLAKFITFKDIDSRFDELLASEFAISGPAGSEWVAVSKALVATSIANTVEQAAPCAAFSAPDISASAEKMISIPEDKVNCRQDPTNCDIHCTQNSDNRSCGGNFFAKKACQIAKDAVNARIATEYAGCLAGAAAKKAVCTTAQAAEQAGCEALKTAFNAALEGEVGNVTAQASGTARAQVCLSHLKLADDLTSVQIDLTASGKANASVSLGFSPRRAVGRAICYLPTTVKNGMTVELSAPNWSASSPITLKQISDNTYVSYEIQGSDVAISYSPSLPSLLLQDTPRIALTCPIPGAALPAVNIAAFVKDLPNNFNLHVPTLSGSQAIPLPTVSVGKQKVDVTLRPTTTKAVVLGGSLERR